MSRLYVGNLPFSTTNESLQELFASCGNVVSAQVITDKFSGRSKGFGFVEMGSAEEASTAIGKMNGTDLGGRALTVSEAKPRESSGGGGREGGRRDGGGRDGGGSRGPRGGGSGFNAERRGPRN